MNNIINIADSIKKPLKPELEKVAFDLDDFPVYGNLLSEHEKLLQISAYPCDFDFKPFLALEKRFKDKPPRGGLLFNSPIKLINHHVSCHECLYAFMIDTYGRGCIHDCSYCYAKSQLTSYGYWNRPVPMPININEIRKLFYTVFETNRHSKWRKIMEDKIPFRIGHSSDSFMWLDKKYGVGKELLRILKFYRYPYIIATRSDLIAHDDYIESLDSELASVQMSIVSTNDDVNKAIEPGAPSAHRRLLALRKLTECGFWTTVRINPLFPIYPDGHFTNEGETREVVDPLRVFEWDMIDKIAEYKVPAILAGFGRFSSYALKMMSKALEVDLIKYFDGKKFASSRDYHFSDKEIRYYYQKVKQICQANGIQFTTCYIGNGGEHFWKDQDLWDNKSDCCNAKGRVCSFKSDSQQISFESRKTLAGIKCDSTHSRDTAKIATLLNGDVKQDPFLS